MLLELRVKGLGIIEEINWSLGQGLNVITGETGAGKSLVIDAVEALLAGKVDEAVIRHGDETARIEGVFTLPESLTQLRKLLAEKGLDAGETLVINGEFRRQGRSVVRVNGTAVPRTVLHQLGHYLIDVHGQSEHLSLLDKKYQLDFLDTYAHSLALRDSFNARMTELAKTEQELKALLEAEKDLARRQEFLRFQIEEISRARLRDGEEEELERERNLLTFSEKLKALSYGAYQALQGEDISEPAALAGLNKAVQMMKKLVEIDPALKAQLGFLEETFYGLDEAARDIRAYHDRLEYDPKRLEEVESRLELIRSLKKKYGDSIAEILNYLEKAQTNLDGFVHSSERRAGLEQTCAALKQEMGRLASELSQKRVRASKKLVAQVKKELRDLNMSQVEFEVSISRVNAADGIPLPGGQTCAFTSDGIDMVEFMASTNPGEPLKPLSKIASTGEISRFMLALKGVLSQADNIPVLVFDEIDTGVGGRSGEVIGKKLWALARRRQVICVTHLPQIAAFADAHFSVHKASGARTVSLLQALQGETRLKELAVMLAGPHYTEVSLDNARELLRKAEAWKKSQV